MRYIWNGIKSQSTYETVRSMRTKWQQLLSLYRWTIWYTYTIAMQIHLNK